MRDDVRQALAIGRSSTIEERTIDITTTGRLSGEPRRIEICFYRFEDSIYLSGIPGPRTRDWLANLTAEPHFIFHLKHGVVADLPLVKRVAQNFTSRRVGIDESPLGVYDNDPLLGAGQHGSQCRQPQRGGIRQRSRVNGIPEHTAALR